MASPPNEWFIEPPFVQYCVFNDKRVIVDIWGEPDKLSLYSFIQTYKPKTLYPGRKVKLVLQKGRAICIQIPRKKRPLNSDSMNPMNLETYCAKSYSLYQGSPMNVSYIIDEAGSPEPEVAPPGEEDDQVFPGINERTEQSIPTLFYAQSLPLQVAEELQAFLHSSSVLLYHNTANLKSSVLKPCHQDTQYFNLGILTFVSFILALVGLVKCQRSHRPLQELQDLLKHT
eukprot:gnl/MRDRNA2_/MRDRNA2_314745_c0_seq1.p1 gnl/MRDRNA2_/MRDRNA2_314745_c0~~gnl/MRDRNA2_/MRDRNA2_314745_c0_seq1.p1  ORF type:complete len:240 (+),score=17.48 gnl/MRDRNA2_/MRDRNA2_314745_c0_seq1:36-722(+)